MALMLTSLRLALIGVSSFGQDPSPQKVGSEYLDLPSLYGAAAKGDILELQKAASSADLDKPYEGRTALMWASLAGQVKSLELLLDMGASVNRAIPADEWTALRYAVASGNVDAAGVLLERGADPHIGAESRAGGLGHLAVRQDDPAMLRLLTANGIGLDDADHANRTPLHYACFWGKCMLAKELVALGVGLEAQDSEGRTPLHLAAYMGWSSIVQVLIELRVRRNIKDVWGRTAAHLACEGGHEGALKLLCWDSLTENWADVSVAPDACGLTPLHVAAIFGNARCIQVLSNATVADTQRTSGTQRTAMQWAFRLGRHGASSALWRSQVASRLPLTELIHEFNGSDSVAQLLSADGGIPTIEVREIAPLGGLGELSFCLWGDGLVLAAEIEWGSGRTYWVGRLSGEEYALFCLEIEEIGLASAPDWQKRSMHQNAQRVVLNLGGHHSVFLWDGLYGAIDSWNCSPLDRSMENMLTLTGELLRVSVPSGSVRMEASAIGRLGRKR